MGELIWVTRSRFSDDLDTYSLPRTPVLKKSPSPTQGKSIDIMRVRRRPGKRCFRQTNSPWITIALLMIRSDVPIPIPVKQAIVKP